MKIQPKKLAIISGCTAIFGIMFGWVIFPNLIKLIIRKQVSLKPGTDVRDMWMKTPFALDFLIYIFNVTNPEEVMNGGKPNLHEIGPYYFEEWKDKYDFVDDKDEDTVEYNMRDTYIFRPDLSNGLTGEEIITIPHPLVQTIAVIVKRERAPMLELVAAALQILFNGEAFYSGPFLDLFFRGFFVDCSSEEFSSKAVCMAFYTGEVKQAKQYNETHFLFSFMGTLNATGGNRIKACRGVKNSKKTGFIVEYDGEPEIDNWDGDECNQYFGTDGTVFPPLMTPDQGIWAFTPSLCRSLGAKWDRKSKYSKMPSNRYMMDLGDIKADESLHCFCEDPEDIDTCPVKGTMSMQRCSGAPLTVSMPHFYNADPSLLTKVNGLNPKEEEHAIIIEFELTSGTPFQAAKRLQFNMDMEPIAEVPQMANLPELLFPLFWVQESMALNKTWTALVKPIFLGKKVNNTIKWTCLLGGIIGVAVGVGLKYKKTQTVAITETKPVEVESELDAETMPENDLDLPGSANHINSNSEKERY